MLQETPDELVHVQSVQLPRAVSGFGAEAHPLTIEAVNPIIDRPIVLFPTFMSWSLPPETRYNSPVFFEWDPAKAESNQRKHGVSFTLAASVFLDPLAWTFPDPAHSFGEVRFISIGTGADESLLVVAHVEVNEETIRIISARPATTKERRNYEEA